MCSRWRGDTSKHCFAKHVWNRCLRARLLDYKPWQSVTSSPQHENCVYIVSWTSSVNSEVHPATPCMPPPLTFLHSTVGKNNYPTCAWLIVYSWHSRSPVWRSWMRHRCLIKSSWSDVYWLAERHRGCKQDCFEPDMLSPMDQHVGLSVQCGHICVMAMMMPEPGTELVSFLSLQEPYTGVQSEDRPISMTLGSALHQRLCQQGLFRRGPMTDRDVAGVFGQNGAIQCGVGGRERLVEERARERERRVRQRRDRAGRGKARQTEGVEELAKLSLTAMGPLDNPGILSEINLSSWSCWACHYDVVLTLSEWQFVQCFPSSPYCSALQRLLPSIHLCLPVWLSLFSLINCLPWAIQSFYQGDLHRNRQLMTKIDVLLEELL